MELQRLTTVFDVDTTGLQTARVQVDAYFSDAEKRASDSVSRFDRISRDIGKTIGTGIKVGLGDIGAGVDSLIAITEKGLKGIPVIGEAASAAFKESAGAMRDAINEGFAFDDMMKRNRISLSLIAGGANDATKELAGLRSISSNSEFGLSTLVSAAEQLQIMQGNAHNVVPEMQAIADAAAALGKGEAGLNAIVNVLARINEMEKVSGRDAKALINQGIPIYDIIGQAAGMSSQRAKRLIDTGRVQVDTFTDAILGYFQRKYPQAAAQMAQTMEVQNAKLATGMAALKGAAFQNDYNEVLQGYMGLNAAIRGPEAGKIAAGFNAAPGVVMGFIKNTISALQSGDLLAGAEKAGDQIIQGLKKGITDKAGEAYSTVTGLAQNVVGAFAGKDGIDSKSPSRKFEELGHFAAAGFGIGFSDGMEEATKSVVASIGTMLDAAYNATGRGRRAVTPDSQATTRAQVESLLQDPNIRAFLEVIKRSEVGNDRSPYTRAFGPLGHVDPSSINVFDSSTWPGMSVFSPTLHRRVMTHPYGPYQAEPGTYQGFARATGVGDLSPHSQDLFAVWDLMQHPAALQRILGGDARGAMSSLDKEWESFAVNSPGKTASLANLFGQLTGGGVSAFSVENPLPVSIVSAPASITISNMAGGAPANANASGLNPSLNIDLNQPQPTPSLLPLPAIDVSASAAMRELVMTTALLESQLEGVTNKQHEAFGAKAQRELHGLRGELLQLGLDIKTVGDSFENNFISAFDHVGEAGHNFGRELALGIVQDLKHNIGQYLAGELRDEIFGSPDGKKKGLLSGIGKLFGSIFDKGGAASDGVGVSTGAHEAAQSLGVMGKATGLDPAALTGLSSQLSADAASVVANTASLNTLGVSLGTARISIDSNSLSVDSNTLSLDNNTVALEQLTTVMQTSGGGSGGGFSKLIHDLFHGGGDSGGDGGDGGDISDADLFGGGFKGGGSFIVGGKPGTDANLVSLRATRGERVTVETPEQQRSRGGGHTVIQNIHFHIDARGSRGIEDMLSAENEAQVRRRVAAMTKAAALHDYAQQ